MKLLLLLLLISFTISSAKASSKELTIALLHTPGVLAHNEENFPYNKLLNYLSDNYKSKFHTNYYPYERAQSLLQSKQVDCLFPVVKGEANKKIPSQYSDTVNKISVLLFATNAYYKAFAEIKGEIVIYYRGFDFGYWRLKDKEQVVFVPIDAQERAVGMLQSGRATAYIDYFPDIKQTISPKHLSLLKYSIEHPLKTFEDSFECYSSEDNKKFITWLNQTLQAMRSSGQLKQLLADYYNL